LAEQNHPRLSELRTIYYTRGARELRDGWKQLFEEDRDSALDFINDPDISFPILYSLAPELINHNESLTAKNQLAMNHIFSVIKGDPFGLLNDIDLFDQYHYCVDCFSWIVKTGGTEVVDENYSPVIDQACVYLLLHLKMDCLEDVVDILFYRNRSGGQRHYLLSAFYDAANPKGIIYVAKFLRSDDPKDVALAQSILAFIPDVAHTPPTQGEDLVLSWLEDNSDYLTYTAENNDSHPYPVPYTIHHTAKYFGIPVDAKTGNLLYPKNNETNDKWAKFQSLPQHIQNRLSVQSQKIRRWSRAEWSEWMRISVDSQAAILLEGRSPYDYY
jgi:hypothetical protein